MKSFYGITEQANGKLSYSFGHERIPENWYPRPTPFGLVEYNVAALELILANPEFGRIGGNTGKVNSFTSVDIQDLTGGALTAPSLLEGNNLICFVLEVVETFAPRALSSSLKVLSAPLELIGDAVAPILSLDCPAFNDLTYGGTDLFTGLINKFPGAKKSGSSL